MSVINTNISAIRAANASNAANKMLGTAMDRLSSGKRINSAKDDAAGLAIASGDAPARVFASLAHLEGAPGRLERVGARHGGREAVRRVAFGTKFPYKRRRNRPVQYPQTTTVERYMSGITLAAPKLRIT